MKAGDFNFMPRRMIHQGIAHRPVRPGSSSRRSSTLRRLAALAGLTASIACDSSGPGPDVTGVWVAPLDSFQANDTLYLALEQDGATVKGFGILRRTAITPTSNPPVYSYVAFQAEGTVTGRTVDLAFVGFQDRDAGLRGEQLGDQVAGVFDYTNTEKYPAALRRDHPSSAGVGGTWALTSTTGGPPNASMDTVTLNEGGLARRHREGLLFLGGGSFNSAAMWRRRGDWIYLRHLDSPGVEDSLHVTSGELQRPYGVTTEHFTRVP